MLIEINTLSLQFIYNINTIFNKMEQQLSQIQSKIYEIRGQKVMLDSDLAQLYGVETKQLKQQVKRNLDRFPPDFMFELSAEEYQTLRSQFVTLEIGKGKHSKYLPFVFTEHGVAMLSSVISSQKAIQMNICVIRAFVVVRQFLSIPPIERIAVLEHEVKRLSASIEDAFSDYNDINEDTRMQLELINKSLAELNVQKRIANKTPNPAGFIAIHDARKKAEATA
ncbi:DNA-binding protein [Bacteroidia bacterium]|nr:DNA-binding protein [Bacteroidia bacterium]